MTGILSILPVEWLAGAAVVALGLVATWVGGRKAGKSAVKLDNLKSEVKAHEIRDQVENRVSDEPDPRERLRSDWKR